MRDARLRLCLSTLMRTMNLFGSTSPYRRILLSITQRHFCASAEVDRVPRNIVESKSTAAPPAFDLTFDKGWLSCYHNRLQRIGELLGGDVAMVVSTTSRFAMFVCIRIICPSRSSPSPLRSPAAFLRMVQIRSAVN